MKIAIIGDRCGTCARFTQYYCYSSDQILSAIDSGYCRQRSRNVRPGDRCKEYQHRVEQEKSESGKCGSCGQYAPLYCAWKMEAPKEMMCGYCINSLRIVSPGDTCGEWIRKKGENEKKLKRSPPESGHDPTADG